MRQLLDGTVFCDAWDSDDDDDSDDNDSGKGEVTSNPLEADSCECRVYDYDGSGKREATANPLEADSCECRVSRKAEVCTATNRGEVTAD